MSKKDEALKLALELKNSASAYWTEKEILVIEKLIKLLAQPEQPAQRELNESDDLTIAYMAGVHRGKELAKQPSTEDSSAVEQPAQQQEQDSCKVCSGTGEVETGIGMMVCDECHGITYTPPPAQRTTEGEEMSKIAGDINREMLDYAEKHTGDCYGDGTVYRGERSADSAVKTYTLQKLAYAKGVPSMVTSAMLAIGEDCMKANQKLPTASRRTHEDRN